MWLLKWIVIAVVTLVVLAVLAGQLGFLKGQPAARLGVTDGKLAPPARTPNSVSSQANLWPDAPRHQEAQIARAAVARRRCDDDGEAEGHRREDARCAGRSKAAATTSTPSTPAG